MAPVLETATDEQLQELRKTYWKNYKRKWRQEHRKKIKELYTEWNEEELRMISKAANNHHMSKTKFIKKAAVAYANSKYLVPDYFEIREIFQFVAMSYNQLKDSTDEYNIPLETGKKVMQLYFELEQNIERILMHPQLIYKETIK